MVVAAAKQIQNQNEVEVAPAISAAISRFLDFLTVERGLSRNTIEAYRRDLLRYSRFLAQTGVQDPTNVPEALVSPTPRSHTRAVTRPGESTRATCTFVRCGKRGCVSSSGPMRANSSGSPTTTA